MGGMSGGGGGMTSMFSQIGGTIGDIAGYHIGRNANAQASRDSQEWQQNANALYTGLYDDTQADYKPYMDGGTSAFEALLRSYGLGAGQNGQADYSGFENSPDYKWNLEQGQTALDRSAASKGRLYSGQQMKASQQFGQGLASQHLSGYRGGLGNISNMGMTATNALSQYRQGYGQQLGTGLTNLGDIRAAEALGRAGLHARFNADQKDVWGVGGGGGGSGGGMSSFGGGGQNVLSGGGGQQSGYSTISNPSANNWNWGG